MNTLTGFQRKRAKHLLHNGEVKHLVECNRVMTYMLGKWGHTTTFGAGYGKFFRNYPLLALGLKVEVTRLRIKVWAFTWETWAYAYVTGQGA